MQNEDGLNITEQTDKDYLKLIIVYTIGALMGFMAASVYYLIVGFERTHSFSIILLSSIITMLLIIIYRR